MCFAYNTIRYDTIYLRALKSWQKASLVERTAQKQKIKEKLKSKTD